jgi:hypothetical protein
VEKPWVEESRQRAALAGIFILGLGLDFTGIS